MKDQTAPPPIAPQKLTDDFFELRIPNPFVEGRNKLYVFKSDPVTIIDSGVATDKAYDAIVQGLAEHGLVVGDVARVILTHKHIDHIGCAWRIQRQSGAEILIHEKEVKAITDVDPDGHRFIELVNDKVQFWGVPPEALPESATRSTFRWQLEAAQAKALRDGDRIPVANGELEVIHTPGHTMGSICLKYGRYLFSGDHVLPDISPNVGGGDMRSSGMLTHYLWSLERVQKMATDGLLVLPGHGEPFEHLFDRCQTLIKHHHKRLEQTLDILKASGPLNVYSAAHQLFGDMRDFHVILGCAEANAHLEYLVEAGVAVSEDGRYRAAVVK